MQGSLPPVDARSLVSPQKLLKDQENDEKQARRQTKNRKKRVVHSGFTPPSLPPFVIRRCVSLGLLREPMI